MDISSTTTTPINFLDLACGTGIVLKQAMSLLDLGNKIPPSATDPIMEEYKFTATDLAAPMLSVLHSRITSESWPVTPTVVEADMRDTKLAGGSFTHLTCNFGPCSAANPGATLWESYRLLAPGGIAGWTGWMALGWYDDLSAALGEIRSVAATACEQENVEDEDERLAKIPDMLSFDALIGKFVGINDLSVASDEDGHTPRWGDEKYFVSQVKKAGFVDVKVSAVDKTLEMNSQAVNDVVKPLLSILGSWWSEEERKVLEGGLLDRKIQEWFEKKIEGSKGNKLVWDGWKAMVVTGRKST